MGITRGDNDSKYNKYITDNDWKYKNTLYTIM